MEQVVVLGPRSLSDVLLNEAQTGYGMQYLTC